MALGEAVTRLAIGIGCRRLCPAAAVLDVVNEACAGLDLTGAGLFTIEAKRQEGGLREAAAALGLPLAFLPADDLATIAERVTYRSSRVADAVGVPSVAEAAALAGAGPGSRLIVPRLAHAAATCAVAAASEGAR
ncbi:MAG: cobalamin biosynthesis protein [Caulobacteraceae bacterium]|nr:cobalamin biosynthesis protein [Caulobacter sp.]